MSTETNKSLARRIPLEAYNQGKAAVFDEIVAENLVDHFPPPGFPAGREGYKMFIPALRAAFPDLHATLDLEIADGEKVAHRITVRGTHKGDFMGIPATGKQVAWTETHIVRFTNGMVVEHWGNADQSGLMMQLMPPQN
jgi:predicted ester cyclase